MNRVAEQDGQLDDRWFRFRYEYGADGELLAWDILWLTSDGAVPLTDFIDDDGGASNLHDVFDLPTIAGLFVALVEGMEPQAVNGRDVVDVLSDGERQHHGGRPLPVPRGIR